MIDICVFILLASLGS